VNRGKGRDVPLVGQASLMVPEIDAPTLRAVPPSNAPWRAGIEAFPYMLAADISFDINRGRTSETVRAQRYAGRTLRDCTKSHYARRTRLPRTPIASTELSRALGRHAVISNRGVRR
jgi:hypothetical protein